MECDSLSQFIQTIVLIAEYVVFDEADRLFEMGFGEQLNETLHRLPESKQMVLFSATLPKMLVDFAKAGLNDPVLIRLGKIIMLNSVS